MSAIPDFNDSELWVVETTLRERYGQPIDVALAEVEMRLDPNSTQLTPCPAVYWKADDCNFILCKTGDKRYRPQVFYRVHQHYGTGIPEFTDLAECVVTLLQVQADHESERKGLYPDGDKSR